MAKRTIPRTRENVRDLVDSIIIDELGVEREKMLDVAEFDRDMGADSLDQIELIMAIENAFDITIPDRDADGLRTVGQMRSYVVSRVL